MTHSRLPLLLLTLCATLSLSAQVIHTAILQNNIKTLRIRYADSERLERPFLRLGGDEQLEISFDELSHLTHNYTYTVLHLNADFTPSDLQTFEYLQGFTTADITDYDYSLNTQQLYTHYRFTFPNNDMQPLLSGNYAIKIYEDGDPNNIVAYQTFAIVDPQVSLSINLRSNTDIELSSRYQQLDIDVHTNGLHLTAPSQIRLLVQQNGRWDNAVFAPSPTYIETDRLRYQNQRSLIFEGGNEYRHFDIASVYYMGYGVDHIDFDHNYYNAFLFPDEILSGTPYTTELDANGQFVINAERTSDDDYEADYMWVHFLLPQSEMWLDGGVYIGGDLFYNTLSPNNRMQYDNTHHCYFFAAYLKQGAYNYQYWLWNAKRPIGNLSTYRLNQPNTSTQSTNYLPYPATVERTEGSHWQTQNEYTVYVYYRPIGARYDQLIAISTAP